MAGSLYYGIRKLYALRDKPSHLDLHCLQRYMFTFTGKKERAPEYVPRLPPPFNFLLKVKTTIPFLSLMHFFFFLFFFFFFVFANVLQPIAIVFSLFLSSNGQQMVFA